MWRELGQLEQKHVVGLVGGHWVKARLVAIEEESGEVEVVDGNGKELAGADARGRVRLRPGDWHRE